MLEFSSTMLPALSPYLNYYCYGAVCLNGPVFRSPAGHIAEREPLGILEQVLFTGLMPIRYPADSVRALNLNACGAYSDVRNRGVLTLL